MAYDLHCVSIRIADLEQDRSHVLLTFALRCVVVRCVVNVVSVLPCSPQRYPDTFCVFASSVPPF